MKTQTRLTRRNGSGLALALGFILVATKATATPYATCLTNNSGVISFRLNEAATTVKILWGGGASSYTLGAVAKGLTVTNLSAQGVTSPFQVEAAKTGSGTVALISDDAVVANQFYSPRGLAVNRRPASPYFGRVYVGENGGTNASARITTDGIYLLNADSSDAVGQGNTGLKGGITTLPSGTWEDSASIPWQITVGEGDDRVYICDWTDNHGNLYTADANMTPGNGTNALKAIFSATAPGNAAVPVGPNNNHGSPNTAIVTGSQVAGDLTLWTVDEDYQSDPAATALTEMNSLWKYEVGAGSFPYEGTPTRMGPGPALSYAPNTCGLARGTNGYFYHLQTRSAGAETCLNVVDSSTAMAVVYKSRTNWIALGYARDWFSNSVSVAVSPDQRYLAVLRAGGQVVVAPLVNGIPKLEGSFEFAGAGTSRQVAFDAADNIYLVSSATERMRVYSLGNTATASTMSNPAGNGGEGGSFSLVMPPSVDIVATQPLACEDGTTGTFTISRGGDTTAPLTVNCTISGTAVNGTDYTTLTTSATIPASANSVDVTVTPKQDATAEATETVILTLASSPNYLITVPKATVFISDTNTPVLTVSSITPSMYERVTSDYATVTLSRTTGNTNVVVQLDAGNFTYGGTAVKDVDYVVNTTAFPLWLQIGDRAVTTAIVSPLNDNILKGDRTLVIGLASGVDPNGQAFTATTNTATTIIVEDEDPPATVLWSDDFNLADSATNYVVRQASLTGSDTYITDFALDYAAYYGLPAAPHSTGDTLGLHLNLNKDVVSGASGMNYYPTNVNFGTNFALRFDMYLFCGSVATSEHATFGINHSGGKTNWFRGTTYGYTNWVDYDGLFAGIQADAAGGTVAGDYMLYSAPRATNSGTVTPTIRAIKNASSFTQVFKNPPYSPNSGIPSNLQVPASPQVPTWAEVELSQVIKLGQPVITLRINHSIIYQYTNTQLNAVIATNGTIMLGYDDPFDSATGNSPGVIYDNARVVALNPLAIVTQPVGAAIAAGGSTTLSVVTSGSITGVTNYQWRLAGTNLPGATSASLPLSNVQLIKYGAYTVVVSDGVFSLTSSTATVSPPAPSIITPPASRASVQGPPAAFSVVAATFSGVTNYQWRLYATNLTGQTAATLSLPTVQPGNFGPYAVTVSDGFSTTLTSTPNAVLSLAVRPDMSNWLSSSTLNLKFSTEVGVSYCVDYKTNLDDPTWIPISTNVGTGGPLTVTADTTAPASRFFRVRVQ